jgi:membrane-anchored protein YejM (alkaline phosphatase superfamily)
MLLVAASVVLGFRLVENVPPYGGIGLDQYAGYNASLRLARDLLAPRLEGGDEDFYRFLAQNSNIPRSARVAPVRVDLVDSLEENAKPKPNIFVFVIDSLRQDFLSPYNPAVGFTPHVAAFAEESTVFRSAFAVYGGTGLSEPSLWVGGLMLHMQYITPFAPMNALQRLLDADGYHPLVSRDSILNNILGPWPTLVELDKDRANMDYDFCATLLELQTKLDTPPPGPLFAYTQPQNLHISVIQRQNESVLPGGPYNGFYAPYASRLARLDACFGTFIEYLKIRHIYDNSVIILTSDHGDSLGESGRWGHAYTIFPEILRVPLIIHVPVAMRSGLNQDPDAVAFLTDIAPSLYYLLGHRPIQDLPVFGRPLFTEKTEDQNRYRRADYLVASSYAAVYGILTANGSRLYIADAANQTEYAFDLFGAAKRVPLSDSTRSAYRQRIRDHIFAINQFYGYH